MRFSAFYGTPAILLLVCSVFFNACIIGKPPGYVLKQVRNDTLVNNTITASDALTIQKTDVLGIWISSLNPSEDLIFNTPGATRGKTAGYQISEEGNIYMHKLGRVPVLGLTLKEVKTLLEKELQPYLKDPVVTVNFENHKIVMLGDGGVSKVLEIPGDRITIFEALGQAGAPFENNKLNDVVVIRERDGNKEIKHINLENTSVFGTPWYYLEANDVVVLTPNKERTVLEQRRLQNQQIATFIVQGVTITLLIFNNFIR